MPKGGRREAQSGPRLCPESGAADDQRRKRHRGGKRAVCGGSATGHVVMCAMVFRGRGDVSLVPSCGSVHCARHSVRCPHKSLPTHLECTDCDETFPASELHRPARHAPRSYSLHGPSMWRWFEIMPLLDEANVVSLGDGTPMPWSSLHRCLE